MSIYDLYHSKRDTNFMTILWQERKRDFKIDIIFITINLWN